MGDSSAEYSPCTCEAPGLIAGTTESKHLKGSYNVPVTLVNINVS